MINHVLLEVFCRKNWEKNAEAPYPEFCRNEGKYASYHCLFNRCPYLDFTSCADALCYIGPESDMMKGIVFGGEMEEGDSDVGVEQWREIAIAKIQEAYDRYMEMKNQ